MAGYCLLLLDSLALYGPYVVYHCHPLEFVDLLMDDHQNEAQLMGAWSDHGTFVLLKSHPGQASQAYSLDKSIPKQ
jgi:hypothetical protein